MGQQQARWRWLPGVAAHETSKFLLKKGCGGSRQTYPVAHGGFQMASDDNGFAPIFDVDGSSLRL
jgi:hypothetical protein